MKKYNVIFILFLFIFVTGCSNLEMSMKINNNRSMFYTVYVLNENYNNEIARNISVYKQKLENNGYFVSEYNKNNKYGMIISKEYDNIDYVSRAKKEDEFNLLYMYNNDYNSEIENKMFYMDKKFISNYYVANFYVDLSNLGIDLNDSSVIYTVELPYRVKNSNADIISNDRKTLTWNISSLGKTEIDYEFELKNYDLIYYIIGVLIAIYLIFSIFFNLFRKGRVLENDLETKNANIEKNNRVNKVVYDKGMDPVSFGLGLSKTNNSFDENASFNFSIPIEEKDNNFRDNNKDVYNINNYENDDLNTIDSLNLDKSVNASCVINNTINTGNGFDSLENGNDSTCGFNSNSVVDNGEKNN